MDRTDLVQHFVEKFFPRGTSTTAELEKRGLRPRHFAEALAPIAARHGVLDELKRMPSWRNATVDGNWGTSSLAGDAVMLGVTILEIEAVYQLTYGGKP